MMEVDLFIMELLVGERREQDEPHMVRRVAVERAVIRGHQIRGERDQHRDAFELPPEAPADVSLVLCGTFAVSAPETSGRQRAGGEGANDRHGDSDRGRLPRDKRLPSPVNGEGYTVHDAVKFHPVASRSMASASLTSRSVSPPASWVESVTSTVL